MKIHVMMHTVMTCQTGAPMNAAVHWRRYNPNHHHQETYCAIYGHPGGCISNAIAPTIREAPQNTKNH